MEQTHGNTTKNAEKNTMEIAATMFHNKRVQVRRCKNPRQGESLDRDDRDRRYMYKTTTNKQDPQDMPAGQRIKMLMFHSYVDFLEGNYLMLALK